MADIAITARKVKPLPGTVRRDVVAGGAGNVGDLVYINSSGQAIQAAAGAAGTAGVLGIVVSAGSFGAVAFVAGDALSVVVLGPVTGLTGMTPGAVHYLSNTAGKVADAAGTVTKAVGRALAADILYVIPSV